MRVAVVTPYYADVPQAWLRQCHASVSQQSYPCHHILVADGPVTTDSDLAGAFHIGLPERCRDFGGTPRTIGVVFAAGRGFDAVAFLDADNWYARRHIESLVALQRASSASVLSSARMLHRLDGSVLGRCTEVDGERFVDTNCLFMTRDAYWLNSVWWLLPTDLHAIDDRIVWSKVLKSGIARAHSGEPTVAYRTAFVHHYRQFGEKPPKGAKDGREIGHAIRSQPST